MSNSLTVRPLAAGLMLALGALVLGTLAACAESPTSSRMGRVSVLLTDAPGDVVSAVVTIDQVYLQPGEGEDGERLVLRDEDLTTDLLTLADDVMEIVDGALVPQGDYAQLRFVISGGYIEVENEDGTTSLYASSPDYAGLPEGAEVAGTLQMPSFARSGLKVTLPQDGIEIGEDEFFLLVDFDVSQSFGRLAGQSGRWVMHPVVTGTRVTPPAEPAP